MIANRKSPVEKSSGVDFGYWKMQITNYLYSNELHLPLKGRPEKMTDDEEWELLDKKAMSLVRLSLGKNTTKAKTTIEMMRILPETYEKPSAINKVRIMRRLVNLRMGEGRSISDHVDEFSNLVMQLASMEILLTDAPTEEIEDALVLSVSSPLKSWVLDFGASFHSCGSSETMEQYTFGNFGKIFLVDGEPLKIVGKGNVRIKASNESIFQLHGVRHIPDLAKNLLSVSQLDDVGYVVTSMGITGRSPKGLW